MRSFARAYRSVWAVSIGTPRFPYHGGVAIDGAWSKGRIEEGSIPVVLNLLALASANSHQFHGSVASFGMPWPERLRQVTLGRGAGIG